MSVEIEINNRRRFVKQNFTNASAKLDVSLLKPSFLQLNIDPVNNATVPTNDEPPGEVAYNIILVGFGAAGALTFDVSHRNVFVPRTVAPQNEAVMISGFFTNADIDNGRFYVFPRLDSNAQIMYDVFLSGDDGGATQNFDLYVFTAKTPPGNIAFNIPDIDVPQFARTVVRTVDGVRVYDTFILTITP